MALIVAVVTLVGLSLCSVFAEAMHDTGQAPSCAPRCAGSLGVFEARCRLFDAMFGYRSARPRATNNGTKRLRSYQNQRGVIASDNSNESARRRVSSAPCQKPLRAARPFRARAMRGAQGGVVLATSTHSATCRASAATAGAVGAFWGFLSS